MKQLSMHARPNLVALERAMMRHKLTKAEQIRGIEKALKNPRTPKPFLPGMRKRLAKLKG